MDRKFIDCITSFDSGFFVFLSCALSLSLVFIAFPFDFTMERACYRIVVTQWPLSRKDRTKIKVVERGRKYKKRETFKKARGKLGPCLEIGGR